MFRLCHFEVVLKNKRSVLLDLYKVVRRHRLGKVDASDTDLKPVLSATHSSKKNYQNFSIFAKLMVTNVLDGFWDTV